MPAWSKTSGYSTTPAFFSLAAACGGRARQGQTWMDKPNAAIAEQIAQASSAFEQRHTGHAPKSVSVILNGDTLVITLRGALSPAEIILARTPSGAAGMQEFHRQLFANSAGPLLEEIKRITGVEVREASAEVATMTGAVMQLFPTGTVVQVFLLAGKVSADTWSGSGPGHPA
jgi:uncharacterized protein YbcI